MKSALVSRNSVGEGRRWGRYTRQTPVLLPVPIHWTNPRGRTSLSQDYLLAWFDATSPLECKRSHDIYRSFLSLLGLCKYPDCGRQTGRRFALGYAHTGPQMYITLLVQPIVSSFDCFLFREVVNACMKAFDRYLVIGPINSFTLKTVLRTHIFFKS